MKKTVLLTGSSRGIGKSIHTILEKDYNVIAPGRKELDLSSRDSVENFVKNYRDKKIDIIINNAGINFPQWVDEIEDGNLKDTFQVNLISPILLVRGLVGNMKKNKWGRIINISSVFGIVARGKQVLYSSTKHGINGMTKALALELAQYNILVNSVCPGFAKTDIVVKNNTKDKIKILENDIPLGRLAGPEEIAELVKFLISDKNTYITGSLVVIDGGFSSK